MLSNDESSGGEELILSDCSDSKDSEEDEIDDINSSIEWQETLINNKIPLFKGHAPSPVVTFNASKIELDFFRSFFLEELVAKETTYIQITKYIFCFLDDLSISNGVIMNESACHKKMTTLLVKHLVGKKFSLPYSSILSVLSKTFALRGKGVFRYPVF